MSKRTKGKPTNVLEREQRLRMCESQRWLCHWCKGPMVWVVQASGKLPPNAATTEHLDDKLSPARGKHAHGEVRRVAACLKCNNARSNERHTALGVDELRRRSGRGSQPLTIR